MITISLCMIVKNEEKVLGRCLDSVGMIADEIIIVDTGSIDTTKKIAEEYTDKIYDFVWIDDFSAARNFAFEKAEMDYILWLDADDIILPDDQIKFEKLKEELKPETDAVMMKYNIAFDEQGRPTFSYFRERLIKRSRNFKWTEPVHEYIAFNGNIVHTDIGITHAKIEERKSGRNIEIYESIIAGGKKLSPRGTYYYARELKDHGRYRDAIRMFSEFLDTGFGWVEDNITACNELARCYKQVKEPDKALQSMLRSFQYDTPRGEVCCEIGAHFKEQMKYSQAIFWYELILRLERPKNSWGFYQEDSWGYIPSLECCVCYDKLGEYDKAELYNNLAAGFKPDSNAVLFNKKYFEDRKKH